MSFTSRWLAMLGRVLAIALLCCAPLAWPAMAHAEPVVATTSATMASAASDSTEQTGSDAEGFHWQDYQDPQVHHDENPLVGGLVFLLKFGVVIGLIYATAWFYRRGMIPKGLPGASNETALRVIGSVPLRGAQTLHIVEIGRRTLVVGSNGKETLVKLAEWEEKPPLFDTHLDEAENGAPEPFSSALDETLRRLGRQDRL